MDQYKCQQRFTTTDDYYLHERWSNPNFDLTVTFDRTYHTLVTGSDRWSRSEGIRFLDLDNLKQVQQWIERVTANV